MEERYVYSQLGKPIEETVFAVPPTVEGLCAFLGISLDTFERYCNPEYHSDPKEAEIYCGAATRARERMREWNVKQLLMRSGKDVKGIIFNLENNYGMKEQIGAEINGSLEEFLKRAGESGEAGGDAGSAF